MYGVFERSLFLAYSTTQFLDCFKQIIIKVIESCIIGIWLANNHQIRFASSEEFWLIKQRESQMRGAGVTISGSKYVLLATSQSANFTETIFEDPFFTAQNVHLYSTKQDCSVFVHCVGHTEF